MSGRRLSRQRLLETFVSNLFIGYLVITGRIQPLSLIALVAIEALLLVAVQAMQMRFIPASAVPREFRGPIAAPFGGLLFLLVVVVLANWLIISVATNASGPVLSILWHPLDAVRHSQLGWPLAVTLALALLNARDDARWHAAHGGDFVSTSGLGAQARILTVILGTIPHVLPFAALLWVGRKHFERERRRRDEGAAQRPAWLTPAVVCGLGASGVVALAATGRLISSGLAGWTIAFCMAKFLSEVFIASASTMSPDSIRGSTGASGAVR